MKEIVEATYVGRQVEIHDHFSNLADYIWKLPRLLDSEIKLEREKLDNLFPACGSVDEPNIVMALRERRFVHEFGKLLVDFPDFMGSSSFVMVLSRFEYFLLLICRDYERASNIRLDQFKDGSRGVRRLLNYVASVARRYAPDDKLAQVRHAITLRNCVVNANGALALSKDEAKIREIIAARLYYPEKLRSSQDTERYVHHPKLEQTLVGERLVIPNHYSHWICAAARDSLMSLCVEASIARRRSPRRRATQPRQGPD